MWQGFVWLKIFSFYYVTGHGQRLSIIACGCEMVKQQNLQGLQLGIGGGGVFANWTQPVWESEPHSP